jgi:hypothetical protein
MTRVPVLCGSVIGLVCEIPWPGRPMMLSAAMDANKTLCILPSTRQTIDLTQAYTGGAQAASNTDV